MKKSLGFTLIELLLSITILAIVASYALPTFSDLTRRYKSEAKGRELFELLILMRTKAYSEHKSYTLCPSENGSSCGKDWASGAILFADNDRDGELDASEKIERTLSKLEDGATLNWNAFNNKGFITFRPNGTTPAQSGNFKYCPPGGEEKYGWFIILNTIGRPYFGKDRDGDGIVENGSGSPLTCDAKN
ncbi:GspH/FimT family pseudopilin [Microbulbifer thermotolerans]|uniref:Type II secretion system protein H n=1 Tax=Microbulbifer thermotolerans TaxID=252514 RepID=A0AB35HZD8_MICTH|nr:GspH/FimT family pseudopilin [Microbulbifer thermotolerans]MCX2780252.1 GspH/FimT family pseudopilin [Microbulbifer thermotolerans]MCX2783876.1 GspH/FimT family pseudopilin [Microbulbifer thermotolerans]MCX2802604.1 GspH/FimT family pseudopilin [Microbulbifer thermotolerans]MCX2805794.1 GspH/FimT family pseudopilin [Microbulbifer thermotolerans]MCX2832524.1 GspH/FimT family pseudopilin [Microbulbifer thermotolerans]